MERTAVNWDQLRRMFHAMNRNAVSWQFFTNCDIFFQLPVWRCRLNRLLQIQCSAIPEESFENTHHSKFTFIPCLPTLVVVTSTYSNVGIHWSFSTEEQVFEELNFVWRAYKHYKLIISQWGLGFNFGFPFSSFSHISPSGLLSVRVTCAFCMGRVE